MKPGHLFAAALALSAVLMPTTGFAVQLTLQNPSFEAPVADPDLYYISLLVDGWTTYGSTMVEYPAGSGQYVNDSAGLFANTPAGEPDHFTNMDGDQAAFLAAETGNEFTQTLTAPFEAGQAYTLTMGVGHSYGQPPADTAKLVLGLFYLDTANQRHFVASTDVLNDAATGLSANLLQDFTATSAALLADDPAVGQPIHVWFGAVGPAGGFFDVDNVRLTAVPEPATCGLLLFGVAAMLGLRRRPR